MAEATDNKRAGGIGVSDDAGLVTGPLTRRASNEERVRQYAGWRYAVTRAAQCSSLDISCISAANVPNAQTARVLTRSTDVADPYVKFSLVNKAVVSEPARTAHQENEPHPVFEGEAVSLQGLPVGLVPRVRVEIWDHDRGNDDDLLAFATFELQGSSGKVVNGELARAPGLDHSCLRWAAPHVCFTYQLAPLETSCDTWFELLLTSPEPGVTATVLWDEAVLQALAHANDKSDPNQSPQALHAAAREGRVDAIEEGLAGGANIEERAQCGWTPLMFAVRAKQLDAVRALLAAKADVEGVDRNGSTPLGRAAYCGAVAVMKALLDAGAKIEAADSFGRRPLHVASDNGKLDAVRLLIQRGAVPTPKDNDLRTPEELATLAGYFDIVDLFAKMRKRMVPCAGGAVKWIGKKEEPALINSQQVAAAVEVERRNKLRAEQTMKTHMIKYLATHAPNQVTGRR